MSFNLNNHFVAVVTFDPASQSPRRCTYAIKPVVPEYGTSLEAVKNLFEDAGHFAVVFPASSATEAQIIADEALPSADHIADVRVMTESDVTAAMKSRQASLTL